MKKYNQQKRNLFFIIAILFVLGIGIGYSVLTEKLDVESSVAINEMKWDIGFSSSEDNGGSILSESNISNNGKTLNVLCDFGSNTKQKDCTVKATITNNSTFDVGLTSDPSIVYDDTYIHTLTFKWNNHPTYENKTVLKDNFIAKGESEEVILTIKNKFINKDNLPSEDMVIPVTITLNFAEWQQDTLPTKNDLAILKATTQSDTTAFRSSTYKTKIKTITFEDKINVPSDATESWDIGVNAGKVMAYVIPNETDSTYYDLYIQSDGQLYANEDMSNWFYDFYYVDVINGLETLDTSSVINMQGMFWNTGTYSAVFTLDVSNFDTSKVTNMICMFCFSKSLAGDNNNPNFKLDVSEIDTSNVTDMSSMFSGTGYYNPNFTLDVSNFDTSKVTNMSNMFNGTGYNSTIFTLDVSNFDTSKVTNMSNMFWGTGYINPTFTLDVSNFDTSKVTNMSRMFSSTGKNSTVFTLDVSNFNTSNVTDMGSMFEFTGNKSTIFTLDVSNFDTSNVISMRYMFHQTGYGNPNFTLDVSNFDTSNVTNMSYMFYDTGYSSTIFTLNVSNFDTSKVTSIEQMFFRAGYNSTKLNTSITIKNPNITSYGGMFSGVATKEGSQIIVNYTSETSDLVDAMIATKWSSSNVIKGVQVD